MHDESILSQRQQRLGVAIAEYLEALDSGEPPCVESWLSNYADVAPQLQEFLQAHSNFQRLVSQDSEPDVQQLVDTKTSEASATPSTSSLEIGREFGNFRLIEEVGRGGMGVVFRALQLSVGREVALKIPRNFGEASREESRRFQREADAVSKLDHPNIVAIYDVGNEAGQPYLAMKLLTGGSLRGCGQMTPVLAAKIMVQVAAAVEHAHRRGILHRDIKPGNVMLDEAGQPVVTDFGLAKHLDASVEVGDQTTAGAMLGTPAYMAPEQIVGDATTLSDVYSLGALFYTLLTGKAPFTASSLAEFVVQVRDRSPALPRSIDSKIPRDLETICMKCLRKEPESRYVSAEEFASDLKRWLAREPIEARPVSVLENTLLFCRRRPALAALSAALFVSMMVGGTLFALQYNRTLSALGRLESANVELTAANKAESVARANAEAEARQKSLTYEFLQDMLRSPDPSIDGRQVTVASRLDEAFRRLQETSAMDYEGQSSLLRAIGDAYIGLGLSSQGKTALELADARLESVLESDSKQRIEIRSDLGFAHYQLGEYQTAVDILEQVLVDARRVLGIDTEVTHYVANSLAISYVGLGEAEKAYEILMPVYEFQKNYLSGMSYTKTQTLGNLGMILMAINKPDEAITVLTQLREHYDERGYGKTPRALINRANLVVCLLNLREFAKAKDEIQLLHKDQCEVLGDQHVKTLETQNSLAGVLMMTGQVDAAVETLQDLLVKLERVLDPNHPMVLTVGYNLAGGHMTLGNYQQALDQFQVSFDRMNQQLGATHPNTLKCLSTIGLCHEYLGQHTAAIERLRHLETSLRQASRIDKFQLAIALTAIARNQLAENVGADKVLPVILEALEHWKETADGQWQQAEAQSIHGECLFGLGQTDEARELLMRGKEKLDSMADKLPPQRKQELLKSAESRLTAASG